MKKTINAYKLFRKAGGFTPQANGNLAMIVIAYTIKQAFYLANNGKYFDGQTGIFEVQTSESTWESYQEKRTEEPFFIVDVENRPLTFTEKTFIATDFKEFLGHYEAKGTK